MRNGTMTRWVCGGAAVLLLSVCMMLGMTDGRTNVAAAGQFRVRVLMAVPDLAGADVWLDDNKIASTAAFRTVTAYGSHEAGDYSLRVFLPGQTNRTQAIVNTSYKFLEPKDYTLVVRGKSADSSVRVTVEVDRNTPDASAARLRFGNALGGTNTLTLALSGSNTALGTVRFGETADYTSVPAGTYEVILSNGGTAITKGSVTLAANTVVSVFAVGTLNGAAAAAPALLLMQDNPTGASPTVLSAATPTVIAAVTATMTMPPIIVTTPVPTQAPLYIAPTPAARASEAMRTALAPVPKIADTTAKRWFDATGHTLGGPFKRYWDSHGGLEQFGYPITEEYMEVSATDGKTYVTQYFERARFELHPDKAGTPFEVQQGLLGRELIKMLGT